MNMQLKDALKATPSFSELLPIAKQLDAKLSFWGSHYLVIEPKNDESLLNYEGTIPLDAVLKRVLEIIKISGRYPSIRKDFKHSEHSECKLLENEINRLYLADRMNLSQSSIITKIFVMIRSFFTDYQFEWNDDVWGRDCQILQRDPHYEWNEEIKDYVCNMDSQRYKQDIRFKKQNAMSTLNAARVDWLRRS